MGEILYFVFIKYLNVPLIEVIGIVCLYIYDACPFLV